MPSAQQTVSVTGMPLVQREKVVPGRLGGEGSIAHLQEPGASGTRRHSARAPCVLLGQ